MSAFGRLAVGRSPCGDQPRAAAYAGSLYGTRYDNLHLQPKNEFLALTEVLERLEAGIARLDGWGLRPHPTSRLPTYLDRLRRAVTAPNNVISPDLATNLQFHFRDIDDFLDILESFPSPPTTLELRRLHTALGDDDHPDKGSSRKARDAQYELRLRAKFQSAGLSVEMADPTS